MENARCTLKREGKVVGEADYEIRRVQLADWLVKREGTLRLSDGVVLMPDRYEMEFPDGRRAQIVASHPEVTRQGTQEMDFFISKLFD